MDYRQLPKIELHLHLDCSLSYQVVQQLDPTVTRSQFDNEFIAPLPALDLVEYINRSSRGYLLMQTAAQLRLVTLDVLRQLDADGVLYAELRFAPLLHTQQGLSPTQVVEAVQDALTEATSLYRVIPRLILCTLRHYTEAESMETVRLVEKFIPQGWVVGFDIAGPEDGFPPTNQLETFEYLRKENAHFTIHAGEAYGLPSIWEAIQICGAERLGHGVRIIDDIDFSSSTPKLGALASYIRDRRIPLELCPTSNLQTGAVKTYSEHPIGKLAKLRFRVTLNTDNRLMSNTSMSNEMTQCVKSFDWKFADLQRVTVNALKSSFIPFEERLEIIEKIIKPGYAAIASE